MNGPALPVPREVARQASQGKELASEVDGRSGDDEREADHHQRFSKVMCHAGIPPAI